MDLVILSLAFAAACACAAVMGYAIQRGATCTVAAVEQLVVQRRARRLAALVEASLWVCGGLLVAHRLWPGVQAPVGYVLGARTLAGAGLLGLGAFVNRACVFGAIARFGSGEWAYAATPAGFYLGCLGVQRLLAPAAAARLEGVSPIVAAPAWAAWAVAVALAWRAGALLVRGRGRLADKLWSPHAATCVIGVAFLAMLLLAGAWAYTDALADLARGMTRGLAARLALGACLLAGAVAGGWTAGRLRPARIEPAALARCLAGGAMMGCGSVLIPGSNDGLILVGMPMLWPYAWAAFLVMCTSIGLAQRAQALLGARGRVPAGTP